MPSAEEHQQQFRNLNRKVNILLVLLTVVGLGAVGVCSAAQSNDLENLSDEATARLAKSQIDSLMANPAYTEYLGEIDYDALVDAYMANPAYLEWLYTPETTREEDCAGVIVGYLAITRDVSTLPDDDVDSLCDWYEARLGPK